MNLNRKCKILFVLLLALVVVGCKDDAYTAAAKSTKGISDSVRTGIDTVQTLYASTSDIHIDRAERDAALHVLDNLTDLNSQFRGQIRTLHSNPATTKAQYLQVASGFVASSQALLQSGALHVKSPSAQAKLDTIFTAIQTGLNGLAVAIQSAKGA
jgi:hypothetical protein